MIVLPITEHQIKVSKETQANFNKNKIYDKFKCDTAYVGYLGEMVFNEFLQQTDKEYRWVQFDKKNYNEPDFIIKGKSVDLKTTFSDSMWIQQEKFDVYIYAQINKKLDKLMIKGWLNKKDITKLKENNQCDTRVREKGIDYIISQSNMKDIHMIF
jgi:hypothetical protein